MPILFLWIGVWCPTRQTTKTGILCWRFHEWQTDWISTVLTSLVIVTRINFFSIFKITPAIHKCLLWLTDGFTNQPVVVPVTAVTWWLLITNKNVLFVCLHAKQSFRIIEVVTWKKRFIRMLCVIQGLGLARIHWVNSQTAKASLATGSLAGKTDSFCLPSSATGS